jgi:co-chaperonin GroES (HSP10)
VRHRRHYDIERDIFYTLPDSSDSSDVEAVEASRSRHLTPLADIVLFELHEPPATTHSGLIVPDVCRRRSLDATVCAVGPDVIDLRPGDHIMVDRWTGDPFTWCSRELYGCRESDVLAVVTT